MAANKYGMIAVMTTMIVLVSVGVFKVTYQAAPEIFEPTSLPSTDDSSTTTSNNTVSNNSVTTNNTVENVTDEPDSHEQAIVDPQPIENLAFTLDEIYNSQ